LRKNTLLAARERDDRVPPEISHQEKSKPMSLTVIGAGFPRTGTASLKTAFELLGLGKCYHMSEVFSRPDDWIAWTNAADGKPVDWDKVFDGFGATTDAPACHYYRQIADHYPDAKVVLSQRDADRWFESTQSTILSPAIMQRFSGLPPEIMTMMHKIGWHPEDPECHDRDYMITRMTKHNEEVKRTIAPDRLLVFEAAQGWKPLCDFVGLPVPDEPFPHVNSTEEFKKMIASVPSFDDVDPVKVLAEQAAAQRNRPQS
jgi:hypothetical protein